MDERPVLVDAAPRAAAGGTAPFFLAPHLDTKIACLPTCAGADEAPRWAPISYEAWITEWTDANYSPKRQHDVAA